MRPDEPTTAEPKPEEEEAVVHECAVCQTPAERKCSGCRNVYYCDKEHQRKHWREHAANCIAYKLVENKTLGRHYVAQRKIDIGEVLIYEGHPLVHAPQQDTPPVCLQCLGFLEAESARACDDCGWPICSKCPKHKEPECRFTQDYRTSKVSITGFGIPHPTYRCIGAVRALALKRDDPRAYGRFTKLVSKTDICTEDEAQESRDIAKFIQRFFDKLGDEFTDDEIVRAVGILQINGHEIPTSEPASIAVYDTSSYLEHSCHANCAKSFTPTAGIYVRATLPIKKGGHITISYTDPLWGTANRRHHLRRTKYFECTCPRCADPTEFGSMFDALKCRSEPCEGYMLPKSFIGDDTPDYECDKCGAKMSSARADETIEEIGRDLASLAKNDPDACRAFIERHGGSLHENHFYMTDVKIALSQLIGQGEGGLAALDCETLCEKIVICRKLNELLKVIVPAENRVRGVMYFDMYSATAEFGRRQVNRYQLFPILEEARNVLLKSYYLLKFEPEILPEGKISKTAKKNLFDLDMIMMKLIQNQDKDL